MSKIFGICIFFMSLILSIPSAGYSSEGKDARNVPLSVREKGSDSGLVCRSEKKNLLWAVKGKTNTVYLFGSIHVGSAQFYPFEKTVESSFEKSKYLVVEIDNTSKSFKEKAARIVQEAELEKGKTLRDVLSPGIYDKLEAEADRIGLPVQAFDRLKPWITAVTLVSLKMQSIGYTPDLGVDAYFLRNSDGKRILELESFDEQASLFEGFGDEKFLAHTLLSLDSPGMPEKLVLSWYCGDLQALAGMTFEKISSDLLDNIEEIHEKMYFSRNRKMADKIRSYLLGEGDYFVVVGVGHLIGDKGIPALLKDAGYNVTKF